MSCSVRPSEVCLAQFVRNVRGEAITNCMLTAALLPLYGKKKNSNKAYRPTPRELALHVFDKWTYTSPSISSSGRAQGRQAVYFPPSVSLSLCIKSTNQGVSVMHPSSRLTSWQLRCKSGSFIPMTLCQYLYGGSCTSLPFLLLVSGNRFTVRQGGREMGIEPSRIKSFDCKSSDPGCLTCQFEE